MTTSSSETDPSQNERLSQLESQIVALKEMVAGLVTLLEEKMKIKNGNMEIPHIKKTFPMPAEVLNKPTVAMVSPSNEKSGKWIIADDSGKTLGNWEFEDNLDFIALE